MDPRPRSERARRRQVARATHPDLGGDSAEFIAAMAALDRPVPPRDVRVVRSVRRTTTAAFRRAALSCRARLPRSWPGARRYGRL